MNDITFIESILLKNSKNNLILTSQPFYLLHLRCSKGYNLGVQNTLLLLDSLLSSFELNEFLINTTDSHLTEYDYDELEALTRKQVYKS